MIQLTRYQQWQRRVMVGQLGIWGEHWTEVSTLPDFLAWQELARLRGRDPTASNLSYHMTRGLLPELLYAAGGVEHEFMRIEEAMEQARQWAASVHIPNPQATETFIAAPTLLTASYCFAQLLMWARAVEERVERRSIKPKGELGLLPALKPGALKDQIRSCKDRLSNVLKDARLLANYALHAGALPDSGTPWASLEKDGRITMLVPDPQPVPVVTWEAFTYEQKLLDITTYSGKVMTAVTTFIDEVLDAFEHHRPARVQPR